MKRCLDIIYKDVHINTHVYIQWNLRTMDKLGVRHLSFVERLSLSQRLPFSCAFTHPTKYCFMYLHIPAIHVKFRCMHMLSHMGRRHNLSLDYQIL